MNPVYLMRGNGEYGEDVTIHPYCKRILEKNRPKSANYRTVSSGTNNNFYLNSNNNNNMNGSDIMI